MSEAQELNGQSAHSTTYLGLGPFAWGALFVIGMFGGGYLVGVSDIERPLSTILRLSPMVLLYPMMRASAKRGTAQGTFTPVMARYNKRMLLASIGYVIGMMSAIYAWNEFEPTGAAAVAIALLPTVPTFVMIWAMGRYLVEENDEYQRYRAMLAALISLGMVLAIGIFYGFLETFGLVPHVWAWWVLPVWAIGLAIAQLILKVRGQ